MCIRDRPSTGYAFAYENAGKVNNWGIELSVGFNQDLGPVQWNSNLIYSMNRNEIKELLPEYVTDRTTGMTVKSPTEFSVATADSYRMILKEGGSMSDIYATKLKQDLHGNILITNGGVSAEENTFIKVGSAAPKYNLGFRNSFSWKGLEPVSYTHLIMAGLRYLKASSKPNATKSAISCTDAGARAISL